MSVFGRIVLLAVATGSVAHSGCARTDTSDVGGESHFWCQSNSDCQKHGPDLVCSRENECVPRRSVSALACKGACCPEAAFCYTESDGQRIGDECLAQRDNSPGGPSAGRLQYRLTWSRPIAPVALTVPLVAAAWSGGAGLPWSECRAVNADGRYAGGAIQLLDIDLDAGIARLGYSKYVTPEQLDDVRSRGLCMVAGEYSTEEALGASSMSPSENWPAGLPRPMAMNETPWTVSPTFMRLVATDFDLERDRESLLQEISTDAEAEGVLFFDGETGRGHGYAPITYQVVHEGSERARTVVPLRETELSFNVNDISERSCIGALRAEGFSDDCTASVEPDDPPWGCAAEECLPGTGPAKIDGYYLITEAEQVSSPALSVTLCIAHAGADESARDGFPSPRCRDSDNWNPDDPMNGLPHGDWCAATNSPATADCHDAWRSSAWQTYQAFDIRDETCPL